MMFRIPFWGVPVREMQISGAIPVPPGFYGFHPGPQPGPQPGPPGEFGSLCREGLGRVSGILVSYLYIPTRLHIINRQPTRLQHARPLGKGRQIFTPFHNRENFTPVHNRERFTPVHNRE